MAKNENGYYLRSVEAGVRSEEKTKLKFDPNKDYTRDVTCLGCHTSGFGMPGGYIVPADGDSATQEQADDKRFTIIHPNDEAHKLLPKTCTVCHKDKLHFLIVSGESQEALNQALLLMRGGGGRVGRSGEAAGGVGGGSSSR